jgi:hypothetical protein
MSLQASPSATTRQVAQSFLRLKAFLKYSIFPIYPPLEDSLFYPRMKHCKAKVSNSIKLTAFQASGGACMKLRLVGTVKRLNVESSGGFDVH